MKKEVLDALMGSIKKWEKIVDGTGTNRGRSNCPLCQMFNNPCQGCPVMKRTGKKYCDGTPYEKYERYYWAKDKTDKKKLKRFALLELKFLKSLLPKSKNRGCASAACTLAC